MAQLLVGEQNTALVVICPYCSLKTDCTGEGERDGKQVAILDFRKAPTTCDRCGSPMEPGEAAKKFENMMAAKEAGNYGPGVGRIVDVPKGRRKSGRTLEELEDSDGNTDDGE